MTLCMYFHNTKLYNLFYLFALFAKNIFFPRSQGKRDCMPYALGCEVLLNSWRNYSDIWRKNRSMEDISEKTVCNHLLAQHILKGH